MTTKTHKLQITEEQRALIERALRMTCGHSNETMFGIEHLAELSVEHPRDVIDLATCGQDPTLEATWSPRRINLRAILEDMLSSGIAAYAGDGCDENSTLHTILDFALRTKEGGEGDAELIANEAGLVAILKIYSAVVHQDGENIPVANYLRSIGVAIPPLTA